MHDRKKSQPTRAALNQRGAALLLALLTVSLVAMLAATAYWQQWRSIEAQTAEGQRRQADWLLTGTLDWAHAQLHDDARGPAVDHGGETWALPVGPVALGAFLAASSPDQAAATTTAAATPLPDASVAMTISDAQSRMNLLNLLEGPQLSPVWLAAFGRLFQTLSLPAAELQSLTARLLSASTASGDAAPILVAHPVQMALLGLSPATREALLPYVTVLPGRVPVNLNTAPAEVLMALVPGLLREDADRLVRTRQVKPLESVAQADLGEGLPAENVSVSSRFFDVRTTLRLGSITWREHALLQRERLDVRTLWREKGGPGASLTPSTPSTPSTGAFGSTSGQPLSSAPGTTASTTPPAATAAGTR